MHQSDLTPLHRSLIVARLNLLLWVAWNRPASVGAGHQEAYSEGIQEVAFLVGRHHMGFVLAKAAGWFATAQEPCLTMGSDLTTAY